MHQAIRCPDPFFQQSGHWIVRRLAPDCIKIELHDLPGNPRAKHHAKTATQERRHVAERLLYAMGCETANVHLGTPGSRPAVLKHLEALNRSEEQWLLRASETMGAIVQQDLRDWQAYYATDKPVRKRAGRKDKHGQRTKP